MITSILSEKNKICGTPIVTHQQTKPLPNLTISKKTIDFRFNFEELKI